MRYLFVVLLGLIIPATVLAGDKGYKVTYGGGSLPDTKAGTELKMYFETNQIRIEKDKTSWVTVRASAITEISYGQDVQRRVESSIAVETPSSGTQTLTALSKSRKQYIGLIWADGERSGGLVMQCDEGVCRSIVAALEAVAGTKAVKAELMTATN